MRKVTVTSGCVAPRSRTACQNGLVLCFLGLSVLALSGCVTSTKVSELAPMPPAQGSLNHNQSHHYLNQGNDLQSVGYEMDWPVVVSAPLIEEMGQRMAMRKKAEEKECRLKDRFDRKALLAYEWSRSRVALDVDGFNVGWGGVSEFESVKLEYRLRLQPEKSPREKCRYASNWQGALGSGYNEFFRREDDAVWQELKAYKDKALNFIDDAF